MLLWDSYPIILGWRAFVGPNSGRSKIQVHDPFLLIQAKYQPVPIVLKFHLCTSDILT